MLLNMSVDDNEKLFFHAQVTQVHITQKYVKRINVKNCSLYTLLTATDLKPQKS